MFVRTHATNKFKCMQKHILHRTLELPDFHSQLALSPVNSTPTMAKTHPVVLVVVVVVVMAASMQAASALEEADCPSTDLTACMPAAHNDIQPTAECCTNLAAYTETATPAECLCQGAVSSPLTGDDDANVQYAVLIPQKCNLVYPPNTVCKGYVIP